MSDPTQSLHSFVPVEFCRSLGLLTGESEARMLSHKAVMMFADISGFSSLASDLAEQGPEGAEELMRLLEAYFGRMVEWMLQAGGHVLKFVGDGVISAWLLSEDATPDSEEWKNCIHQVAECAHQIREELNDLEAEPGVVLGLKIAVAAGDGLVFRVGGTSGHWELLVAGPVMEELGETLSVLNRGEVMLSQRTWPCIAQHLQGEAFASGQFLLTDLLDSGPPPTPTTVPELTEEETHWVRRYVPEGVLSRLDSHTYHWLSELRWVTVAFLQVRGMDFLSKEALQQFQQVVDCIQLELRRCGGALDKVQLDEKGLSFLVAFGLPPTTEDRREQRALTMVSNVSDALHEMGLEADIGMSSGRAFCGPVGNIQRSQNSLMSNHVNLGARLMQLAKDEVLMDPPTATATGLQEFHLSPQEPVSLKGFPRPVTPYQLQNLRTSHSFEMLAYDSILGREEELELVYKGIQQLKSEQQGSILFFDGEAGIGKTYLASAILSLLKQEGCQVYSGAGQAARKASAWHVWQPVFSSLCELQEGDSTEVSQQKVFQLLEAHPELKDQESLLNPLFQWKLPDTDITRPLTGPARAHKTHEILLRLLQDKASGTPTVLLLDDAHWFDSASWRLLWEVTHRVAPVFVLVMTRPLSDKILDWQRIRENPVTVHHILEGLSEEQTRELMQRKLSLNTLPEEVVHWVFERGQGSPFVSLELALALKDSRLWEQLEQWSYKPMETDELLSALHALPVPGSIEGIVVSRVDKLTSTEQLTLKTASVLGDTFSEKTLNHVLPTTLEENSLSQILGTLVSADMLISHGKGQTRTFSFVHRITQEAAYGLLLRQQRQELHQRVALWLEDAHESNLSSVFPELAFHWARTEKDDKAFSYFERAGQEALRNGAHFEAKSFFKQALRRLKERQPLLKEPVPMEREAFWSQRLGESYYGMGLVDKNIYASAQALDTLAIPVPEKGWKMGVGSVWNFWKFLFFHFLPPSWLRISEQKEELFQVAANAAHRICNAAYSTADSLLMTYTGFVTGNMTLRMKPFPGSSKNLALLALILGWFQLTRLAEHYFARGHRDARSIGDLEGEMFVSYCIPIYLLGEGREWTRFESELAHSRQLCEILGNQQELENCDVIAGVKSLLCGELDRLDTTVTDLVAMSRQRGNALHECWGYTLLGSMANLRQEHDRSAEIYRKARKAIASGTGIDDFSRIVPEVLEVQRLWQVGDVREATRVYEDIADSLYAFAPPVWTMAHVRSVALKFSLFKLEHAPSDQKNVWLRHCRQNIKGLVALSLILPIAKPFVLWGKASLAQVMGKKGKALRLATKALGSSKRKGTQPLTLRIHELLATLEFKESVREEHRSKAKSLSESLGIPFTS